MIIYWPTTGLAFSAESLVGWKNGDVIVVIAVINGRVRQIRV